MVRIPIWLAIGTSVIGAIGLLTGGLTGPQKIFVVILMGATAAVLLDRFELRRPRPGTPAGGAIRTQTDGVTASIEHKAKMRDAASMATLRDLGITEKQLHQLQWVYLDLRYDDFYTRDGMKPGLSSEDVFGGDFERWVRSRVAEDPVVDEEAAEAARTRVRRKDETLRG